MLPEAAGGWQLMQVNPVIQRQTTLVPRMDEFMQLACILHGLRNQEPL